MRALTEAEAGAARKGCAEVETTGACAEAADTTGSGGSGGGHSPQGLCGAAQCDMLFMKTNAFAGKEDCI